MRLFAKNGRFERDRMLPPFSISSASLHGSKSPQSLFKCHGIFLPFNGSGVSSPRRVEVAPKAARQIRSKRCVLLRCFIPQACGSLSPSASLSVSARKRAILYRTIRACPLAPSLLIPRAHEFLLRETAVSVLVKADKARGRICLVADMRNKLFLTQ